MKDTESHILGLDNYIHNSSVLTSYWNVYSQEKYPSIHSIMNQSETIMTKTLTKIRLKLKIEFY